MNSEGKKCSKSVHYEGLCIDHDLMRTAVECNIAWYVAPKQERKLNYCRVKLCENRYKPTK